MIDHRIPIRFLRVDFSRRFRAVFCHILSWACAFALNVGISTAADVTFNISLIAESNPIPPVPPSNFSYADVWTDGTYAYVGSDRSGQGMAIFDITNPTNPVYLTTYAGSEMEDVEVWDGIGYFGSDVHDDVVPIDGTGVDIVDLSIPFSPSLLSRVDESLCSAAGCGHYKVHTLSVNNGHLYTADNETDVVKIVDVSNPSSPQVVKSLDIGAPSGVASHEVVAFNDRLYVASKSSSTTTNGWFHIYDVSNPANPVLLKAFLSGARTHTATPTADGNTLVIAEERSDGNVLLYDISMINQANDPDSPVLLSTLNRTNVGIDAHSPHHPHLYGNLLFLAWYEAGLQVFNVADPANPIHVGAFDTYPGTSTNFNGNWGIDMSLGLDKVLLSDRSRGLIVVDASGVLAAGDYNQDGTVDADDYTAWRNEFGATTGSQHHGPLADGNNDGIVDAADYLIWRKNEGQMGPGGGGSSGAASPAVPEPTAMLLVVLSLASCASRRRLFRRDMRAPLRLADSAARRV